LWLAANVEVEANAVKYLIVQSFDPELKRHVLRSIPSKLSQAQEFDDLLLMNCIDTYYSFSSVVEDRKVRDEVFNQKQHSLSLFQFAQVQRNNMLRLQNLAGFQPASDLVDTLLQQYTQLSRRELGSVLAAIKNLRDTADSPFDVVEAALVEIDDLAQAQELARSLHAKSRPGNAFAGEEEAYPADDVKNGRGKGTKGKGKGKGKGNGKGQKGGGAHGKGGAKGESGKYDGGRVEKAIDKWKGRQNESAEQGGARPRPRPPPGWQAEKDWKCPCGNFVYQSRRFCTWCKKPRPDGKSGVANTFDMQALAKACVALMAQQVQQPAIAAAASVAAIPTINVQHPHP